MDLDDILEADTFDRATLVTLAERIRASTTLEQFIYRESELDEVWRLVDMAVAQAGGASDRTRLEELRRAIMETHDLVGIDHRPAAAANRLNEALLAGMADG